MSKMLYTSLACMQCADSISDIVDIQSQCGEQRWKVITQWYW